ncbi:galactose-binding domain-like protein [Lactifluus subvellereus]|nr:galactose-binding domain-like protein [Lactifluus subvellereus]
MLTRLITPDTRIKYVPPSSSHSYLILLGSPRVSSTLDKSFGKSCLVDGSPETCWTSQQGLPQYIQLAFPSPVTPERISLTFQGGFVGTTCVVATQSQDASNWQEITRIYPEDVNRAQMFDLAVEGSVRGIKLVFEESSDFFGRITVYDLMIEGQM